MLTKSQLGPVAAANHERALIRNLAKLRENRDWYEQKEREFELDRHDAQILDSILYAINRIEEKLSEREVRQ